MDEDQMEATLNLLGWLPVAMQVHYSLVYGMTRGADFYFVNSAGHIDRSDVYSGQTAIALQWSAFRFSDLRELLRAALLRKGIEDAKHN